MARQARYAQRACAIKMPRLPKRRGILHFGNEYSPLQARPSAYAAKNQRQHEQNDEHDKEYLGDTRRAGGNAAETEYGGDDGDDEKYGGPVEHDISLRIDEWPGALVRSAMSIRSVRP